MNRFVFSSPLGVGGFLFFFLSFSLSSTYAQRKFTLSGIIRQTSNDKPLPRAAIYVDETGYGSLSDTLGRYQLLIPKGTFNITVTYQGFFAKHQRIDIDNNLRLDILMDEKANDLEEVVISANSASQNVKRLETGVTNLSIKNIKKLPTLLGELDIIKSLFSLPGVASVGEGASGFNVRGGNIDQNLILMDNAPVFNASHLMGFFSVFNPDALRDMNFYRGGIPAQYGGRTASVLNINLKDANAQQFSLSGGLGLVSSRLMVEAPIIKDRMSFFVASRFSYVGYLFKLLPQQNIKNTKADFYDITAKLEFRPTKKDKIAFTGFTGFDKFKVAGDSLANLEVNASSSLFDWRTTNATLAWVHSYNAKFTSKISGVYSSYAANIINPDSALAFKLASNIVYKNIKADFNYLPSEKQKIDFGISAIDYQIQPGKLNPDGAASQINPVTLRNESALESAIYVNDEIEISKKFSVLLGLRYSYFGNKTAGYSYQYQDGLPKSKETIIDSTLHGKGFSQAYGGIEPRFSAKYSLNENASIKFSLNRMRQYIQLISNTTAALPTARWKSADEFMKPQIADQISIGYFQNLQDNKIEASIEFFYKKLTNVSDYKDGANLLLDKFPEASILQGTGRAYGAELYIKKNIGLITGWLSYTYSQTEFLVKGEHDEETINNGKYFPPNYNKPHILNLIASYQATKRLSFSTNFTYSTGRPITYPTAKIYVGGLVVPYYANRNQNNIPNYVRLDLAMNIDANPYKTQRFKGSWNFSVYNALNTRNAYSIFFRTKTRYAQYYNRVDIYKLSILGSMIPSISYNFKF
jgi:ferric enterobactin receptor